VQVTALADRGPGHDTSRGDWQTTKLFHPTQGMIADAAHQVADWGERNSTIYEVTWSAMAVDTTRYNALRTAVNDWSIALKNAVPAQKTKIVRGFNNAKSFWQAPTNKDLYDLAKQINAKVSDTNLKAKGTAVMNALDAVVLYRRFTGSKYNMVHGITITGITRPVEKNADWAYYHTLDFALTTGWDEFEDLLAS
jgi:DNA-binding protein